MWLLVRYTHRRAILSSAMRARVLRARRSRVCFLSMSVPQFLLLGLFQNHHFISVTNALAFVRLRGTVSADFSSHLANALFVSAFDQDLGLSRRFTLNTFRHLVYDRVREAKRQVQGVTLCLSTVTYAYQLQFLLEAFANAIYHVVQQC